MLRSSKRSVYALSIGVKLFLGVVFVYTDIPPMPAHGINVVLKSERHRITTLKTAKCGHFLPVDRNVAVCADLPRLSRGSVFVDRDVVNPDFLARG